MKKYIESKLSRQLFLIIILIITLFLLAIVHMLPKQMIPIFEESIYTYLRQPLEFVNEDMSKISNQEIAYIYVYNNKVSLSDNFFNLINTKDVIDVLKNTTEKYGKFKYKSDIYYYYKSISSVNNNNIVKISITNDNYIKEIKSDFVANSFPIILVTVLSISLILVFWAYNIIKKIEKLKRKVENIDNDEYNHEIDYLNSDEVSTLERAIEDMRISLKHQEEYRNTMYQNISHDFKTPITVIKSYLEANKDGLVDNDKFTDVVMEQTEMLEHKVHSLLYLNKLDYFKDIKNKDLEVVDIVDIVNKSIDKFKYKNKDLEFIVVTEKKIKYYGTNDSWEAVVDNILNNFIRYADTVIKVSIRKDRIIFYNDGPNIEKDLLESIFIPFRKGIKGEFGIGLSVVKKTLNYIGYDVSIKNNKKGVSFVIKKN